MTLSELRQRLEDLRADAAPDDARLVDSLVRQIDSWREDDRTPTQLMSTLDRTLGHVWFSTDALHDGVHRALEGFRPTVSGLGGMTMNERLFSFDLFERWDNGQQRDRAAIYAKLEAKE